MHPLIPYIWAAGAAQLLVASASLFAPRMLHYRENLAKLAPIVRQIFIVMNCYIVLVPVASPGSTSASPAIWPGKACSAAIVAASWHSSGACGC
jgi:hypothetical protein